MCMASTFYADYRCIPVTHVISSLLRIHRSSKIASRLSLITSAIVTMRRLHLGPSHDEWWL